MRTFMAASCGKCDLNKGICPSGGGECPLQKLRRAWPKDVVSYLIMPITFPIWLLGRTINPDGTDTYFIDRVPDQKMLTVSLDDLAEIFAAAYTGSHGLSDCWENMKRQLSPDAESGEK